MRGQLFSLDFVISFAIIILTIGVTLQAVDLMQKKANTLEALQSNNAETIADAIVANKTPDGFAATVPYTIKFLSYKNTSSKDFNWPAKCEKNVFVAKRMMTCSNVPTSYCQIEVLVGGVGTPTPTTLGGCPCVVEVRTCE